MNTKKTLWALLPILLMIAAPFVAMAEDTSTDDITYTVLTDCSDTGYDENQLPQNLFDGDTSTKWHLNYFTLRKPLVVTFQASKPIHVCGYAITTGDDTYDLNLARNPMTWALYGRNDRPTSKTGTAGWTLIDEVTDDTQLTGDQGMTGTYSCKTAEKYEYFKWVITAVRDANKSNCVQASEFTLFTPSPYVEYTDNTLYFRYSKMPDIADPTADTETSSSRYFDFTTTEEGRPAWIGQLKEFAVKKVVIDEDFRFYRPQTCHEWFSGGVFIEDIEGLEYLDTSEATDMESMFFGCSSLTNIDLSTFNTEKVTSMREMFSYCQSLQLLDPSNFTTTGVTDMQGMFNGCSSLKWIDLTGFDTSNVTDMYSMFTNCSTLKSLDLSTFSTDKVTNMANLFSGCSSLTELIMPKFTTASVTDTGMQGMFNGCSALTALDISKFNTDNVTDMSDMFRGCSALTELDLTNYNTAAVTNMQGMFNGCTSLVTIFAGSGFSIDNVTNDTDMFLDCTSLRSHITYDAAKTGKEYANCTKTGYFTDKSNRSVYIRLTGNTLTFYYSYYKQDGDYGYNWGSNIPGWNTSKGNGDITKVVFDKSFKDQSPTTCYFWFQSCVNLATIEGIENLNTSNTTDMSNMFGSCFKLTSLDLSGFDTQNLKTMNSMFGGCHALTTIYVSDKFKMPESGNIAFDMCYNLKGAIAYDESKKGVDYANYKTGYFTKKVGTNGSEIVGAAGETLAIDNLDITDDKELTLTENVTVGTATYSRDMTSEWGTLCLPIDIDLDGATGFKAYRLTSQADDVIELEELSGTLPAGLPVIIRKDRSASGIALTTTGTTTSCVTIDGSSTTDGTLQLVGTYTKKMFTPKDKNCYILKNDMLMNTTRLLESTATSAVGIKQFRAYVKENSTGDESLTKAYSLFVDEEPTAISTAEDNTSAPTEYYDMQGRRTDGLQKGINIVKRGNKTMKVIIK